jgi:glycosyltransferase involved in cell wall biosynthesis
MNPERRKILLLIPSLEGGGAERVFSLLLAHLDCARFELHLGVLQGNGSYMGNVPADVTVHRLNISRVRYALPSLLRLAWRLKPQTILSTLGHLNLALIAAKPLMPRGTRLLIRESAIASSLLEDWMRHPRFWKFLYRRLYKRADKVVCLSDSMVNDLAEHFDVPREKLVRIYNPVDVKQVRELAECGKNPYSGAGPHLVAAGRLTRQKGFDVLLDALPYVRQRFPDVRLTILGQGPLQRELREQSERLKLEEIVSFVGFQSNPWLYLRYADLFVLPSRYEGTSNTLLEALALGKRAVVSDCPGGSREIAEGNEAVVLVPPEDASMLARVIVEECDRLTRGLCPPASTSSLNKFELTKVVEEYSSIL